MDKKQPRNTHAFSISRVKGLLSKGTKALTDSQDLWSLLLKQEPSRQHGLLWLWVGVDGWIWIQKHCFFHIPEKTPKHVKCIKGRKI